MPTLATLVRQRLVVWVPVLLLLIATCAGDNSPRSQYDETGNEVTSSRLVVAPDRPQCAKATTLTYCLDDATYPGDDIQREISINYGPFYKMYAEVSNQTTASLVDGVSVDEEATYDYVYYYGDKQNLPTKTSTKDSPAYKSYAYKTDYYKNGGYICPAFINYGSIYQAMNARGEWQYIVNLKPWTQTVRLEQCFYPMAPCSYMSTSFATRCVQKYSFQRLIAFEPQGRGLYTDIFRLPTSCNCYIRPSDPQSALPAFLQSDASQSLAYVDSSSSKAEGNSFKPVRVHYSPPNRPTTPDQNFAQAGSMNVGSRGTPSWSSASDGSRGRTWSADVGTPMSHASDQDSRLVERRRIRPEGFSLSDITSDPDVGPSAFGYMDNGPPRNGPEHRPSMYQPVQSRYGSPPRDRGPMYQGDGSQMSPSFTDDRRGPYYDGPGMDYGPPGPPGPMQRGGASQDRMWSGPQGPSMNSQREVQSEAATVNFGIQNGAGPQRNFQMRQSSGFYDYNSAHGDMNSP